MKSALHWQTTAVIAATRARRRDLEALPFPVQFLLAGLAGTLTGAAIAAIEHAIRLAL